MVDWGLGMGWKMGGRGGVRIGNKKIGAGRGKGKEGGDEKEGKGRVNKPDLVECVFVLFEHGLVFFRE